MRANEFHGIKLVEIPGVENCVIMVSDPFRKNGIVKLVDISEEKQMQVNKLIPMKKEFYRVGTILESGWQKDDNDIVEQVALYSTAESDEDKYFLQSVIHQCEILITRMPANFSVMELLSSLGNLVADTDLDDESYRVALEIQEKNGDFKPWIYDDGK